MGHSHTRTIIVTAVNVVKRVYAVVRLQCGNSLILVEWSKVNSQSQHSQRSKF